MHQHIPFFQLFLDKLVAFWEVLPNVFMHVILNIDDFMDDTCGRSYF